MCSKYSNLNSNPYHYGFKFMLTSNKSISQNFKNSESIESSKYKKRPNLDQTNLLGFTIMRNQQKRRREKRTEMSASYFLCKWLWVVKTKNDVRKKKKEGVLEGCLLFSVLFLCWFLIIVNPRKFFWSKYGRFLYFENSNGFEFSKF